MQRDYHNPVSISSNVQRCASTLRSIIVENVSVATFSESELSKCANLLNKAFQAKGMR